MNIKRIAAPALGYFALVFGAGFLLGSVRVLWLEPRFGVRAAELAEIPFMLLVVFFAARRTVRRFAIPPAATARLGVGLGALACLLALEFTLVLWLRGIAIRDFIAQRDPVSGAVYTASLLVFALMPLFVDRPRKNYAQGD